MKKLFRIFILIFAIALAFTIFLDKFSVSHKDIIDSVSAEYGVDRHLVYALIRAESGFNEDAESSKGAIGLMQLTKETATWCASNMGNETLSVNLKEPNVNINLGCYYLKYLLDKYEGSESAALAAYNAGPGNVDEWLKDERFTNDGKNLTSAPYPETDTYIKRVDNYKKIYSLLYNEKI